MAALGVVAAYQFGLIRHLPEPPVRWLEAVELLARVDRKLARDLSKLLGMKTRAGHSSTSS